MRGSRGTIAQDSAIGGRVRRACIGAVLLAATVACGDRTNGPEGMALEGRRIDGALTVVSRITDPGSGLPRTVWTDSATFSAEVRDGIAVTSGVQIGSGTAGRTTSGGRPLASWAGSGAEEGLELAVAHSRGSARQGTWRRRVTDRSGRVREIELAAHGGEPISERTISENGVPLIKVIESWRRAGTGWLLTERSVIAYREGVAGASLTILVSSSAGEVAARAWTAQNLEIAAADVLAPALELVARAMTPAALHAAGACEQQLQAMDDAMDEYLFATVLVGAALLSGNPIFVAGAAINEVKAARELDVAEQRLDDCVAGK